MSIILTNNILLIFWKDIIIFSKKKNYLIYVCASVICNITFIANAILQRAQNGKYMTAALYEITYLTGLLLNRPGGGHGR